MRFLGRLLAFIAAIALCTQQAAAQDVSILRDSETERLLKDMINPLVIAAGLPKDSKIMDYGVQAARIAHSRVFVLPSPSGQARKFWALEPWGELAAAVEALARDSVASRGRGPTAK